MTTTKNPLISFGVIAIIASAILMFLLMFSGVSGDVSVPLGESVNNSGEFVIENTIGDYSYDARIIEVVSGHAWENHGTEVNTAFNCLNNNGSAMSFKTFGFTDNRTGKNIPTNLWLCKNGDDWYAIVTTIFEKVGGNKIARLVTAYRVSKDIFPTIESYVQHIISKWGAAQITYTISAGEIFLQPK